MIYLSVYFTTLKLYSRHWYIQEIFCKFYLTTQLGSLDMVNSDNNISASSNRATLPAYPGVYFVGEYLDPNACVTHRILLNGITLLSVSKTTGFVITQIVISTCVDSDCHRPIWNPTTIITLPSVLLTERNLRLLRKMRWLIFMSKRMKFISLVLNYDF